MEDVGYLVGSLVAPCALDARLASALEGRLLGATCLLTRDIVALHVAAEHIPFLYLGARHVVALYFRNRYKSLKRTLVEADASVGQCRRHGALFPTLRLDAPALIASFGLVGSHSFAFGMRVGRCGHGSVGAPGLVLNVFVHNLRNCRQVRPVAIRSALD